MLFFPQWACEGHSVDFDARLADHGINTMYLYIYILERERERKCMNMQPWAIPASKENNHQSSPAVQTKGLQPRLWLFGSLSPVGHVSGIGVKSALIPRSGFL